MIKAIFFDLDNTLYDQMEYFLSGFATISDHLSQKYALAKDDIYSRLMTLQHTKGSMYTNLFDGLLDSFGIHDKKEVQNLIHLYHTTSVDTLSLYEDAADVLPGLAEDYLLGLITNGNAGMQRRKAAALNLNRLLKIRIYTADIGFPKPSPQGFQYAISISGTQPSESIYVGDNPYTDFAGPYEIGMSTVRIVRGEFKDTSHCDAPISMQVHDFYELEKQLQTFDPAA